MKVPTYFPSVSASGQTLTFGGAMADVTGITQNVQAGGTYEFEIYLTWQAAATTTNLNLGMVAPSATYMYYKVEIQTAASGAGNNWQILGSGITTGTLGSPTATTNFAIIIRGIVQVGTTGGALKLQAKSQTANATIQSGGAYNLRQTA